MELDRTFSAKGRSYPLDGRVDPAFAAVIDAFTENYRVEEEVGSAVSVVVDGKTVVDLWGGYADAGHTKPWAADTIVCMMSVAKGITGISFSMAVDRGLIDIDAPVATYWPEFAAAGKETLPVRYILDHRAGLPVLTTDRLWRGAMYDREAICRALAAQAPMWEPGTVAAYHVHTQGYLLGEILRRVTGKTVGPFARDEISDVLGAEYWIGLKPAEEPLVAQVMPNMDARLFAAKDAESAESLRGLAFLQNPDEPWFETLNSPIWRQSEIASGNGHGNARGVARIYGALVARNGIDGTTLMSTAARETMTTMQHDMIELLQERHYRQGLAVLLNSPDAVFMGPNPRAFGHHGIGGSIGFADPDARVGFSYACNKMHSVGTNGPRAKRLIEAVYSCL